jgi:uroporphyrin-III C-methyltransferase
MSQVQAMGARRITRRGKVWLVGAGPGDPELLTVRAHRLIANADVLAYDELVSPEILALAPANAEKIPVGRRAAGCRHHEARIHPLVVVRALEGREVVRVKGGDPFVFGRGGEEAEELAAARVPFEVVPGISAALGAAASTHIPLTHREASASVTFATAHAAAGDGSVDVARTVPQSGTVVFYMGLGRIEATCAAIVAAGRAASTPAAVVSHATLPSQRTIVGTLADIAARARDAEIEAPALLIVGEVVARQVESPLPIEELAALTASVGQRGCTEEWIEQEDEKTRRSV